MPIYIPRFGGHSEKPPVGSVLDAGHPLAKDLVVCALFNEGGGIKVHNCANPNIVGTADSPTQVVWSNLVHSSGQMCGRIGGPGVWSGSGPGVGMFDFGTYPSYFENLKQFTFGIIAGFDSDSAQAHTALELSSGSSTSQRVFSMFNSGNPALWFGGPSNGSSFTFVSMTPVDGQSGNGLSSPEFPVWTWDGATLRGYLNGLLKGSSAFTGLANPAGVHLTIGNRIGGNASFPWVEPIYAVYFWRRALSAAEVQWLYTDPWVMIRRAPPVGIGSRVAVSGGGGGGSLIKARRTLEQFGTRAGSRQLQWR